MVVVFIRPSFKTLTVRILLIEPYYRVQLAELTNQVSTVQSNSIEHLIISRIRFFLESRMIWNLENLEEKQIKLSVSMGLLR